MVYLPPPQRYVPTLHFRHVRVYSGHLFGYCGLLFCATWWTTCRWHFCYLGSTPEFRRWDLTAPFFPPPVVVRCRFTPCSRSLLTVAPAATLKLLTYTTTYGTAAPLPGPVTCRMLPFTLHTATPDSPHYLRMTFVVDAGLRGAFHLYTFGLCPILRPSWLDMGPCCPVLFNSSHG